MFEAEERLLAEILDLFSRDFDRHAVLRGGMVLRILGSMRYTNDLDYVFVPYSSMKEIVKMLTGSLKKIENAVISHSINSKCVRVTVRRDDIKIQVEVKVEKTIKSEVQNTGILAQKYNLPPRLIRVLDFRVALAHKLAAWNERRLARDIYDACFYLNMGVLPERKTLQDRLKKPEYSKLIRKADRFPGKGLDAFYDFIREWTAKLTEKQISDELESYLDKDELTGLAMRLRSALTKLR